MDAPSESKRDYDQDKEKGTGFIRKPCLATPESVPGFFELAAASGAQN